MSCTPPFHTGFWGFIYDWQTIIAGFLAIGAAIIGAIAVYRVGNAQMAAAKKKDRLQAKSLAVAILPEILQLRVHHDRAMDIVHQEFPKIKNTDANNGVAYLINMAAIELPPVLSRSIDQLYILKEAGATLTQLYSVTMQYNSLIKKLCDKAIKDTYSFNASKTADDLDGHLLLIRTDIDDAEKQIEKFHD